LHLHNRNNNEVFEWENEKVFIDMHLIYGFTEYNSFDDVYMRIISLIDIYQISKHCKYVRIAYKIRLKNEYQKMVYI